MSNHCVNCCNKSDFSNVKFCSLHDVALDLKACLKEAINWMITYQTEHPGLLHARALEQFQKAVSKAEGNQCLK